MTPFKDANTVDDFETTADLCCWTADHRTLPMEMALVGEAYRLVVYTVHPKEYRSFRAVLLLQRSQFGSGVALRKFRQSKRGATQSLRVFDNELYDLARQAYPSCDVQSRLSLSVWYIIVEKNEQFNRCMYGG